MRDLALRSLRHGAALGNEGDAAAAAILAAEIDSLAEPPGIQSGGTYGELSPGTRTPVS